MLGLNQELQWCTLSRCSSAKLPPSPVYFLRWDQISLSCPGWHQTLILLPLLQVAEVISIHHCAWLIFFFFFCLTLDIAIESYQWSMKSCNYYASTNWNLEHVCIIRVWYGTIPQLCLEKKKKHRQVAKTKDSA